LLAPERTRKAIQPAQTEEQAYSLLNRFFNSDNILG
jgi:hypothetical protein